MRLLPTSSKSRSGPRRISFPDLPRACAVVILLATPSHGNNDSDTFRVIEFETTEVTSPDVAVSPDGQSIVFSMLGHLFLVPIDGGVAEQLTHGPYYHGDPAFSPDGKKVAFASDRDGSEANVFILDLSNGQVSQMSREKWAARPAWSPDGESLLFLSYPSANRRCQGEAIVKWLDVADRSLKVLTDENRTIRSVFFGPNGAPGWSVVESAGYDPVIEHEAHVTTVEFLDSNDNGRRPHVSGWADRVLPDPSGKKFYALRDIPWGTGSSILAMSKDEKEEPSLVSLGRPTCTYQQPSFGITPNGRSLVFGKEGGLMRWPLNGDPPIPIDFSAKVRLEIMDPASVPTINLLGSDRVRSIQSPRLSLDGETVVFAALGFLWSQAVSGGPAKRITDDEGFERDPSVSPDGRHLAYVRSRFGEQEIRVLNLETGSARSVAKGRFFWTPEWARDGSQLVIPELGFEGYFISTIHLAEAIKDTLSMADHSVSRPTPHFSHDGKRLFFQITEADSVTVFEIDHPGPAAPRALLKMPSYISNIRVSPDERWIAFSHNDELWYSKLDTLRDQPRTLSEQAATRVSERGGEDYAFTPDGEALIYAEDGRVWIRRLSGNGLREVPIQLEIKPLQTSPLLLENVRVLDFETGGFSDETDLFIQGGRIEAFGSPLSIDLPSNLSIVDADGRFVIPGLIDAHIHVEAPWWNTDVSQTAQLAYGVTTVRDMGETLRRSLALSERSSLTSDAIPRYVYAGDALNGVRYPYFGYQLFTPGQARNAVRLNYRYGVHFLKAYASLAWPLQLAVASEARQLGLPISAHGTSILEIVRGVTHGFSFLEHLPWTSRLYDDVFQLLANSHTYSTPTVSVMGGTTLLFLDEPQRLEDPKFQAFFSGVGTDPWTQNRDFAALNHEVQLHYLRRARRNKTKLLVGTDYPFWPGFTVHTELEFFVMAGFEPLEALRLATEENAVALGLGRQLGTVEVGKFADIVILDRNPLEDIRNTESIWRVLKNGRIYDPEALTPTAFLDASPH